MRREENSIVTAESDVAERNRNEDFLVLNKIMENINNTRSTYNSFKSYYEMSLGLLQKMPHITISSQPGMYDFCELLRGFVKKYFPDKLDKLNRILEESENHRGYIMDKPYVTFKLDNFNYIHVCVIKKDGLSPVEKYKYVRVYFIGSNAIKIKNKLQVKSKYIYDTKSSSFIMNTHVSYNGKNTDYNNRNCVDESCKTIDKLIISNKEKVLNFFDGWYNSKQEYIKYGLAYRQSMLICGPPGTGKTALCAALAKRYNYELITIKDPMVVPEYYHKCVILFDEIDKMIDKDKDPNWQEKLRNLMKLLDSVGTSDCIIIATTNYYDALLEIEPALVRPGRFNETVTFDFFGEKEAKELVEMYGLNWNKMKPYIQLPIQPSKLEAIVKTLIQNRILNHMRSGKKC